jgi:hypothetical protein
LHIAIGFTALSICLKQRGFGSPNGEFPRTVGGYDRSFRHPREKWCLLTPLHRSFC